MTLCRKYPIHLHVPCPLDAPYDDVVVAVTAHHAVVWHTASMPNRVGDTARELVVQHGCVRLESAVLRVLTSYKQRFVEALPEADRPRADFSRAVFVVVAFYVVARKNKVKVDRKQLISQHSVNADDFANTYTSMYDLCFDQVGIEKRRRDASERKTNTNLLQHHRNLDKAEQDKNQENKEEFQDWAKRILSDKGQAPVPSKRLKQATLMFAKPKE